MLKEQLMRHDKLQDGIANEFVPLVVRYPSGGRSNNSNANVLRVDDSQVLEYGRP